MINSLINELKIFAKHLSVLVVEDDEDLKKELIDLLSCFYFNVDNASNGKEGLNLYKKNRYDIVITDLRMPEMNGLELSREIKTLNHSQIVMVFSGYIDEYVIELIDIGIDTLLLKPYKLDNLLQKLLKHSENIVLKKDFDKLIVDKSFNKIVHDEKPKNIKNQKMSSVDDLATKVVDTRMGEEFVSTFTETHLKSEDLDKSMWKYMSEDIENLNYEYEQTINSIMLNGVNEENKRELVRVFNQYYQNLSLIGEITELSRIFLDLANTLDNVDIEELNNNSLEVFDIFEFFYDDIINFFHVVFINNETNNINYLTDSLRSSVIQVKVKLGLMELEEDELELF